MNPFCRKKRHTLSGKLVILFLAIAALVIVSVGSIIAWSFRAHFEENIRPHLMQYLEYIQTDIGSPPNLNNAHALAEKLSVEIHFLSDTQQWSTTDNPADIENIRFYRQLNLPGVEYGFGYDNNREYLISRYDNYTLAFSIPHIKKSIIYKAVPLLVVLIALALLYHATRRLFAPIEEIKEGIALIGSGELGHRLNIKRCDELGELAYSINTMADDIEQMLEAKRQLLLAISHELRSPLTRAKIAAALLDDANQRDGIQQDLDEMEKLINELLETERLSSRHSILNKSTTTLQILVQGVLDEYFPHNGVRVDMPQQPIEQLLDQARIKLMLKNIIENAVMHNTEDAAPPSLQIKQQNTATLITIRDHGQGIEAQHLPHLTEPFYRTDQARHRQTGGYGLGLYLCKVIAEAHGGELFIDSQVGIGTTVKIVIPYA